MKNIRTFLKVCHDKFGLRNSELFDPFDLFDVRDFGKVSALSSRVRAEGPSTGSVQGGWPGQAWPLQHGRALHPQAGMRYRQEGAWGAEGSRTPKVRSGIENPGGWRESRAWMWVEMGHLLPGISGS